MLILDDSKKTSYIGDFETKAFGVEGEIHSDGTDKLLIKNFKYTGLGPAGVFWIGTEGIQPSSNGILLQVDISMGISAICRRLLLLL